MDQLIRSLRAARLSCRTFSTSCRRQAEYRDPYLAAQARARKAANISRQAILSQQRQAARGDPVRGIPTEFVQSFDQPPSELNFSYKAEELDPAVQRSRTLAMSNDTLHETAAEALKRITSLGNGSSKDRLRANVSRCISTFGRHNTDATLAPRAPLAHDSASSTKTERAGLDTGSSEVQIAVLTARIRNIAHAQETRGRQDKANKRNLRLLVHKRQKLLAYLYRRERGGPRWLHCIETLGLTASTWKGEISLA